MLQFQKIKDNEEAVGIFLILLNDQINGIESLFLYKMFTLYKVILRFDGHSKSMMPIVSAIVIEFWVVQYKVQDLLPELFKMSKWNKQPTAPINQQFLQNQQRRKQMIIQAARRRKEKQKKMLEQEEQKKKNEQEALSKHKQEKKDAYIKYLRNNIYDKYEEEKRKKKETAVQIKPMAKWKKKSAEKEEDNQQLDALDLNVNLQNKEVNEFDEEIEQKLPVKEKINNNQNKMKLQFEKQWQFDIDEKNDLLSSKLLDSLDLDIGTLNRNIEVRELINQKKKQSSKKQKVENDEIDELRDIIGYQSIVIDNKNKPAVTMQKPKITSEPIKPAGNKAFSKKAEVDEVQLINQLKNKKEAKNLQWAIQEQQQAEDLFSQCSSINKKKQPKALKQLNEEMRNKKAVNNNIKALQTIKQIARQKIASRQKKTSSIEAPKQIEQKPAIRSTNPAGGQSRQKDKRFEKEQPSKSLEKKANSTVTSNPTFPKKQQGLSQAVRSTSGFGGDRNVVRVTKNTSRQKSKEKAKQIQQKQQLKVVHQPKVVPKNIPKPPQAKKAFGNLPPLPGVSKAENNSIATHDMQIDVQSFIRQDLLNLNQQQAQIQEQLRLLHKNNRNNLKQAYEKHEIRDDYRHSYEIIGEQLPAKPFKYYQTQDQIEESLQNLDNYLIRRDLNSKESNRVIREVTQQQISQSLINPFSNSQDLCNQVLQLAKNVSRFEKKATNDDPASYGYINRMKRNNSGNKIISQQSRMTKGSKKSNEKSKQKEELSESRQVSEYLQQPLSRPPFIFDASEISSKLKKQQEKTQKIHVNTKLLKGLLLDDD